MPAYKDEAHGTFYASFYYTDFTGTKRKKMKRGFKLKRDALEWERQFLLQKNADPDMRFGDFVSIYRSEKRERIREHTWESKDNIIDTKILPYFKDRTLSEIEPRDVIAWQNTLMGIRQKNGKPYSPTYLKSIHSQELLCKGWFLPPKTYDCGSFVVNGKAVSRKGVKIPQQLLKSNQIKEGVMKSIFEEMGGTYRWEGDYCVPNIELPEQEEYPLGKYGRLYQSFLEEHHSSRYAHLILEGQLWNRLIEIDKHCNARMEVLIQHFLFSDTQLHKNQPPKSLFSVC